MTLEEQVQQLQKEVQELQSQILQIQQSSPKYEILIKYRTGDSFGSDDAQETIGAVFDTLEYAKDALVAIKEHYEFHEKLERNYNKGECAVIRRKIELSPWVVKDHNSTNYSLKVQVNDNTSQVISAFWMGYFEQIYSAEIIFNEINDSSTKITL